MKKELQKASDLIDEIYQNIKNIKSIDEVAETLERMTPLVYTAQALLENVESSLGEQISDPA